MKFISAYNPDAIHETSCTGAARLSKNSSVAKARLLVEMP
ncbi:hypothetical protein SJ05684_c02040 [Sinorhizobium sojae CCBAU 05684]|uniref:Uncharacterized protein n=1 Tax=Sinorhizobium sojae CCBAU 05684 TaxID=716928 RepID=A0A249P6V3_9HYPH|nr:hypothetical protein SJ05684_c02040 [Sinorhizobium sojae CCBAU 05684]